MDTEGEDHGEDRHGNRQSIDGMGTVKKGVSDSTESGTGDGGELKSTGVPGDGVREMFFRNQVRENGPAHRKAETAANSDQYQNPVDQVHRLRSAPTDPEQQRGTEAISRITPYQQLAAIKQIGGMSGKQKQNEAGSKLGQTDISEIERPPRDLVNLPSDGDRLHLQRKHDEEARQRVRDKVRMGEGDVAGKSRVFLGQHSFCILRWRLHSSAAVPAAVRRALPVALRREKSQPRRDFTVRQLASQPVDERSHISRPKSVVNVDDTDI